MGKDSITTDGAYLVIRDGQKWSDVFRLVPGRTVTIGRADTNKIVVREDKASRLHAEIFFTDENWMVRDLGSRNGTLVGDEPLQGDRRLEPGDVVHIASTELRFVDNLSNAYDAKGNKKNAAILNEAANKSAAKSADDAQTDGGNYKVSEPQTITHRRRHPKILAESSDEDLVDDDLPPAGLAAKKICRLAFELANVRSSKKIADRALESLIKETGTDSGAVLLVPRNRRTTVDPKRLEVLATYSKIRPEYQRVSKFLAETALRNNEAVLARDVEDDSALGLRDAEGKIYATSVICAPIRLANRSIGLVHLYSTTEKVLDPDDLEFTLAVAETIGVALKTTYREQKLVDDLSKTKNQISLLRDQLGVESEIVGNSPAMFRVHQQISKAAPSRATVLVRGESGVGKELVARSVHLSSDRSSGPFICLNCAALSESLLESELFGHEKGAFTGATERKAGKFEAADKGTLMLDEIGEMSQSIQAKFLRVLEGHPFERVGGTREIRVNVRVIAATNRDLEESVRQGTFRKDLFFRLHVVQIDVPPLRERPEDVLDLAEYFLDKFKKETGRRIDGFSPEVIEQLQKYSWPGNVRELKNVIERGVVLASGSTIEQDDVILSKLQATEQHAPTPTVSSAPFQLETLEQMEARHIAATLESTGWNKSQAAKALGIERSTLDRKIKKFGLTR